MRKIAVCGKGGSGKSMFVALMGKALEELGYKVLIVDSDESNPGLFRMLGFGQMPQPFIEFLGGKKSVQRSMIEKLTSGEQESGVKLPIPEKLSSREIPGEYFISRGNLRLLSIGKIREPLEGCACPMGAVSREFLGRIELEDDEIILVDMEAGVEHFGRGVEANIDVLLALVEPSFESLEVACKAISLAWDIGVRETFAVLNKIPSEEAEAKLKEELKRRGVEFLGTVHYDPVVFEACLEGKPLGRCKASEEVRGIVHRLVKILDLPIHPQAGE